MVSYSQNQEDLKIYRYFQGRKGTLLSVGENDGTTLSNAKLLIEHNWSAYLLEPSSVFNELQELHKKNKKVKCFNLGLGTTNGKVKFWESANHIPNGADRALVSSTDLKETERWRKAGVEFEEKEIDVVTFDNFWKDEGEPIFDFISIDCEGLDWDILQQIDLEEVGCRCLIIEWNGDTELEKKFTTYCNQYRLKEIHRNSENLLYAR